MHQLKCPSCGSRGPIYFEVYEKDGTIEICKDYEVAIGPNAECEACGYYRDITQFRTEDEEES